MTEQQVPRFPVTAYHRRILSMLDELRRWERIWSDEANSAENGKRQARMADRREWAHETCHLFQELSNQFQWYQ